MIDSMPSDEFNATRCHRSSNCIVNSVRFSICSTYNTDDSVVGDDSLNCRIIDVDVDDDDDDDDDDDSVLPRYVANCIANCSNDINNGANSLIRNRRS